MKSTIIVKERTCKFITFGPIWKIVSRKKLKIFLEVSLNFNSFEICMIGKANFIIKDRNGAMTVHIDKIIHITNKRNKSNIIFLRPDFRGIRLNALACL